MSRLLVSLMLVVSFSVSNGDGSVSGDKAILQRVGRVLEDGPMDAVTVLNAVLLANPDCKVAILQYAISSGSVARHCGGNLFGAALLREGGATDGHFICSPMGICALNMGWMRFGPNLLDVHYFWTTCDPVVSNDVVHTSHGPILRRQLMQDTIRVV